MINTIANKIGWLKRAYSRTQSRKQTEKALSDLTDFELNDIGLISCQLLHTIYLIVTYNVLRMYVNMYPNII